MVSGAGPWEKAIEDMVVRKGLGGEGAEGKGSDSIVCVGAGAWGREMYFCWGLRIWKEHFLEEWKGQRLIWRAHSPAEGNLDA